MKRFASIAMPLISSFIGVILGYYFIRNNPLSISPSAAVASNKSMFAENFTLKDSKGKKRIQFGTSSEGSPAVWFYDNSGKSRLNVGLYGDGNSFMVLNDQNELAVQIFRTVGPENLPVLVMKSNGRDRIIMGINGSKEPFLVTYDKNGVQKSIFGSYP